MNRFYDNGELVAPEYTPSKTYRVKGPKGTVIRFAGGQTLFGSYEEARRAVRKLLRKKVKGFERRNLDALKNVGLWDDISRNPTKLGGYKIVSA